jgi:hypothetical protein
MRDAAPVGAHFVALEVLPLRMARAPLMKFVTVAQMASAVSHGVAC